MKKIYIKPEIDITVEELDNLLKDSIGRGSGERPDVVQAKRSDWELSGPFEAFESFESSEMTGSSEGSSETVYAIPGID